MNTPDAGMDHSPPDTLPQPGSRETPIGVRELVNQLAGPAALLEGEQLIFGAANAAYEQMVGQTGLIGRRFPEVLPDIAAQGIEALLRDVYVNGRLHVGQGLEVRWDADGDGVPEPHLVDLVYQPLRDPRGRVWGILAQITERTEEIRSERARAFLSEASDILASSLDYDVTLGTVTHLAVQGIADWCAIDERTPGGEVRRIAVAHPNPAMVRLAYELQERYPPDPNASNGVANVLRTGKPELVPNIPDELLVAATHDEEHLRLVRQLGLRSYICVPLIARGVVLGAITFVSAESGRRYGDRDLDLARELARRAAIAIDNARLFRESMEARDELEAQATELEAQAAEMEVQAEELQQQTIHLEEAQEQLTEANRALQEQTRVAQEARDEAVGARTTAELASRAKSQFLTVMSHELRTPLNAIIGYEDLLEAEIAGPISQKQREHLQRIRAGAQQLLELINQILSLARIEAGKEEVELQTVDLAELIPEVQALVEPMAVQRGLSLMADCGSGTLEVLTDPGKVRQILLNLLANGIKFTDSGWVEVSLERGGGTARINVRDTGPGIAPELQERIFEPFVQVDLSSTRRHGGTGLGLAVSRDLARLLGGDLRVESTPGAGSIFTLSLPLDRHDDR